MLTVKTLIVGAPNENLTISRLALQMSLCNQLKPVVENEDVVGAALTGYAPTTSD